MADTKGKGRSRRRGPGNGLMIFLLIIAVFFSVLLLAGPIIKIMGKRNTIVVVLLFTGLIT